MALKKKPVTGMKDMMPAEMEVRDYVIGLSYRKSITFLGTGCYVVYLFSPKI